MSHHIYDLTSFIADCAEIVDQRRLDRPGAYRRYALGDAREQVLPNPYGCADAANILATIGGLPRDPATRADWVQSLQDLQDPSDGLFHEPTHSPIHCTAHCLGALYLFDTGARQPIAALAPLIDPEALPNFLHALDWVEQPWTASHKGAGIYAALVLNNEVDAAWQQAYFEWVIEEFDPLSGFLRRGAVAPILHKHSGTTSTMPHLAGTFHYLFNMEYARRPLPYPAALIDSCLQLWQEASYPLGTAVSFAEIDWIFCLTRARQQCGHRWQEVQQALHDFTDRYLPYLFSLDPDSDARLGDLHLLFGALCALAELQRALPGRLRSVRPLQLVLDRRPFI